MNCKRIGMILLAALVSAGILAGCAGSDGKQPITENMEVSDKAEWNYADYVSFGGNSDSTRKWA